MIFKSYISEDIIEVKKVKHVSEIEKDFSEIYKSLWPQIYKFIYYKVQNCEEAEELTQEVFQRVYKQFTKSNIEDDKVRAYTFAAARNIVYDAWKQRKKDSNVIRLDEVSEKGFEVAEENRNIEDNLFVKQALSELPPEDRNILQLRIIKGYSISEVSKMLGKPEGTVKSLQFRALQKLREKLLKGGYFDE